MAVDSTVAAPVGAAVDSTVAAVAAAEAAPVGDIAGKYLFLVVAARRRASTLGK